MAVPVPPIRVAVLGGGVAGCSFVYGLRQLTETAEAGGALLKGRPLEVSLFEMGRGVGGRAATRMSREMPDMQCDHGAPFFEARSDRFQAVNARLMADGFVSPFDGIVGTLRPSEGQQGWDFAAEAAAEGANRFKGTPGMNGLCRGLLGGGWPPLQTCFSTMVAAIEAPSQNTGDVWRLFAKDSAPLGEFDWLAVASSGTAHPRWTKAFGGPPPLVTAAKALGDPQLDAALESIAAMTAEPVTAVMMAFQGAAADEWAALPWSVAKFEGDPVLGKVVVRRVTGSDTVTVVLHSTHEYSAGVAHVYGSTSTAARVGGAAAGSAEQEGDVVSELLGELRAKLVSGGLISEKAFDGPPAWGPHLHRWGNAFPGHPLVPLPQAVCPDSRILFCGDFVDASGDGNVEELERAALSGLLAADTLAHKLS